MPLATALDTVLQPPASALDTAREPLAAALDTVLEPPAGAVLVPDDLAGPGAGPGAVAIRLVTVPELAPPYDDTGHEALRGPAQAGRSVGQVSARSARVASSRAAGRIPAGHWPSQFAQVLVETLAGARPASQLAPWTTDLALRRISQLGRVLATPHRPHVRRVIVTSPAGGVLEMTVIVVFGNRVRALAVRLERARQNRPQAPDQDRSQTPGRGHTPGQDQVPDQDQPSVQDESPDPGQPLTLRRWSLATPASGQAHAHQEQAQANRQGALAAGWCCTAIEAA